MSVYGKLIINEFGNGFVNANLLSSNTVNTVNTMNLSGHLCVDKELFSKTNMEENISIYINKKDLNNAFHNEIIEVEYYKKKDLYYGKVINYSLINKIFIGYVHHFYLDEIFIYCSELKKSNLISIKKILSLTKNSWVVVKIQSTNNNKLFGELLEILPNDIDTIIEKKFNLTNICIEQNDINTHIEQNDINTHIEQNDINTHIEQNDINTHIEQNDINTHIEQNDINTHIEQNDINTHIEQNDINTHIEQCYLDTFTIDPERTQDCDDAFSIEFIDENNIKIYVHISDVAHWINPNNPLFYEIIKRGNTFYGKNKNWPMIPRNYSDNYCSILPNKKTYVVTNEFIYNKNDNTLNYNKWYYSVIESKNKYNYDYVDSVLNFDNNQFKIIYDTSMIIKKDINDFNLVNETKSHIMVKYWMIKVNQIMSGIVQKIYRSNLKPSNNKFELLKNYFEYKGINIESRNEIIKFINENPTKFNYYMIKNLLTKAYYYSTDKTHYGLGINNYTHWTSPIRRACDLLNHCILKGYDINIVPYLEYMNEMELKQDLIEEFIINFNNYKNINIGNIFEATIIKLNSNCIIIYIEDLDNKFSLHISKLSKTNEKLIYDENDKLLMDENCMVLYKLFDKINVRLTKIDFEILDFDIYYDL